MDGTVAKTLLIRAIGPTLKILGVASILITAAVAVLAFSSAAGAAPKIQQGFAVLHQLVGGFLS